MFTMLKEIDFKIERPELFNQLGGIPKPATSGSAGYDIFACIEKEITIFPGETVKIPTGFSMHIKDPNWSALFIPRSGLGSKKGLVIGNLVGLIDSDYQGECFLPVWNRNLNTENHRTGIKITPGERITQMIFVPVAQPRFNLVENFSNETERGQGGFGSTGS